MQLSVLFAGQADGIIAGMSVTPDARKATFDFSESYYTANTILGVKESSTIASYEDLKGKTVGVKNGTASQTFLTENQSKNGYKIKLCWWFFNVWQFKHWCHWCRYGWWTCSQIFYQPRTKIENSIAGTPIGETALPLKRSKSRVNWNVQQRTWKP